MADAQQLKKDLWSKMAHSPFVMIGLMDGQHSEPLTAQLDQDQVDTIFFFIGKGNRLAKGGHAMAQFVSKGHDFFACLAGTARIDNDFAMIDKLWNRQAEAYFPEGKDDPNLALLRFEIESAEMWETDMTAGAKLKMLVGGTIRADETGSHAHVGTTAESSPG